MRKPMTTNEVCKAYPEDTQDYTCSMRCLVCDSRIWFKGDWLDEDTPDRFVCPYCDSNQDNPAQRVRDRERVK